MQDSREYAWGEVVGALHIQDTALRRWFQRDSVNAIRLDNPPGQNGRLIFTVWDVARLAVARDFVRLGMKVEQAMPLARSSVDTVFGEKLVSGQQPLRALERRVRRLKFISFLPHRDHVLPKLVSSIDPRAPEKGMAEIYNCIAQGWVVRSIDRIVANAWASLSQLPTEVAQWVSETNELLPNEDDML